MPAPAPAVPAAGRSGAGSDDRPVTICGCCRGASGKKPTRPLSEDETDRKCTDLACLLLFVLFIGGLFVIAGMAWSGGSIARVKNGVDFRGCVCGTTSVIDSAGKCSEASSSTAGSFSLPSKSIFAVPIQDVSILSPDLSQQTVIVCASTCPSTGGTNGSASTVTTVDGVRLGCVNETGGAPALGSGETYVAQAQSLARSCAANATYFATVAQTRNVWGYCAPSGSIQANMSTAQAAVDAALGSGTWGAAVGSIGNGWAAILLLCIASVLVAFVYLYVVRLCAAPLTALAIVTFQVALLAGGAFFILQAGKVAEAYGNDSAQYSKDSNWQMNFYGGIALEVAAVLYLIIMVFMWKRIFLAIALLKHAGKVLADVWGVIFLPIGLVVLSLGVVALWCYTTVLMFSLGELKTVSVPGFPPGTVRTFSMDDATRYALLYQLFGLFWVTQFIEAVSELTIAFVATHWFFSPRTPEGRKALHPHTTLFAFNTVLRYHLGTAAFGSAVIAIIKFIRAMIEYANARLKKRSKESVFVRAAVCCCRCCFWCLDCCMRFINRNAYTVVALTKQGFCASASTAFGYIARNIARVGALAGVSTAYLFLGKLFVTGVTTLIGYIVFTQLPSYSDPASDLAVSSPFWPCLVLAIVSYRVGSLFMSVYAVTIDAMLMCYVFNEDKHLIDDEATEAITSLNAKAAADGHGESYERHEDAGEVVTERPTYGS